MPRKRLSGCLHAREIETDPACPYALYAGMHRGATCDCVAGEDQLTDGEGLEGEGDEGVGEGLRTGDCTTHAHAHTSVTMQAQHMLLAITEPIRCTGSVPVTARQP